MRRFLLPSLVYGLPILLLLMVCLGMACMFAGPMLLGQILTALGLLLFAPMWRLGKPFIMQIKALFFIVNGWLQDVMIRDIAVYEAFDEKDRDAIETLVVSMTENEFITRSGAFLYPTKKGLRWVDFLASIGAFDCIPFDDIGFFDAHGFGRIAHMIDLYHKSNGAWIMIETVEGALESALCRITDFAKKEAILCLPCMYTRSPDADDLITFYYDSSQGDLVMDELITRGPRREHVQVIANAGTPEDELISIMDTAVSLIPEFTAKHITQAAFAVSFPYTSKNRQIFGEILLPYTRQGMIMTSDRCEFDAEDVIDATKRLIHESST